MMTTNSASSRARSDDTFLGQVQRNLLAIISLVVALSALGYNTYRNELTETNRNVRSAGFEMLQELSELQLIADYAHYDKDTTQGNPITGWGRLLYMRDMSLLMSAEVVSGTELLTEVWGREWSTLHEEEVSNQRITEAINALRDQVRETITSLE
jgi:hypothetical protein